MPITNPKSKANPETELECEAQKAQNFSLKEDDLEYFCEWKTTLNIFVNGRQPEIFLKMEDELKYIFVNERGPQITQIISINVRLFKLTQSGWLT